ncbi:hypothetical protein DIURU_001663 [Diutina rugosa]|uniref:Cyclin-like domain-containing protein n=1 Tax=Diutina rugosa TaxID=5481 RepID=A0A642UTX8_DIURU|nr:uncharacterized protein DIURU_001663 [Diutina rugosa]KAA8905235.1 hypothetical protein DIURU_001663 [Diutina rugosa]
MSVDHQALELFLQQPVNRDMVHKLVVATLQILPCKNTKSVQPDGQPLPSLMTFLTRLVKYTNIYTGTLMTTLVYLQRLKARLPANAQGLPCTRHRILLSCIIVASKFHNDSSPKNCHWAHYTDGLFSSADVNLMERQLYCLLNWDLRVSSEQLIVELESFLAPIRVHLSVAQDDCYDLSSPSSVSSSRSPSPMSSPTGIYRHGSVSSVSSIEVDVDPLIEITALKEEHQLQQLLNSLKTSYND